MDINVHPAKTELRFAREAEVRSFVIGALQRALGLGAGQSGHHAQLRGTRPTIRYPQDKMPRPNGLLGEGPASHRLERCPIRVGSAWRAMKAGARDPLPHAVRRCRDNDDASDRRGY